MTHVVESERAVSEFKSRCERLGGLYRAWRRHGLDPRRAVELWEMIFHRFEDDLIAENWRMTYPDGVYAVLTDR